MFFRRETPKVPSFNERMESLRQQGYTVTPETGGGMRVARGGCASVVREKGPGSVEIDKPGVLLGSEIAVLCDGGYQKFWLAPSGARGAATADQVRAVQNFMEDLREALDLISLYNEALGSTNEVHLYDRVKDRDFGVPKRPWER